MEISTYTKDEIDRKLSLITDQIDTSVQYHEEDIKTIWERIDLNNKSSEASDTFIYKDIDEIYAGYTSIADKHSELARRVEMLKNRLENIEEKYEPKSVNQYQYRPYWQGKSRYILQSFGILAGIFGFGLLVPSAFAGIFAIPILAKVAAVPLAAKATAMAMGGTAGIYCLHAYNEKARQNMPPVPVWQQLYDTGAIVGKSTLWTISGLTAAAALYNLRKSQFSYGPLYMSTIV